MASSNHVRHRTVVKKGATIIPFGDPPRLSQTMLGHAVFALAETAETPSGARELVWARLTRAIQRNQKRGRAVKARLP